MNSRNLMPARARKDSPRGARESRTSIAGRLQSWLRHHKSSARDAWNKMLISPVQASMTTLVIAIALALPAALYVTVGNLQQVSAGIESTAQITLYLQSGAKPEAISTLQGKLQAHPSVAEVSFISAEDALTEFQQLSGLGESLQLLDENPLPAVLMVQPVSNVAEPEAAEALVEELREWGGVDDVRLDMKWVQRLHAILEMGRRVALALGIALALGVLLVVGNTIRLAVQNRRDEIVVVKLVGGTDGYVRRPFLYTGLWYGLIGGLLGWLLVWAGMLWLDGAVAGLSALYRSGFRLSGPGFVELGTLLLSGAVLGLLGAWLAVGRHLRDIESS